MTVRGVLLDFYGTVVHEDDDVIAAICDAVRRSTSQAVTAGGIASRWWSEFAPLCGRSHGDTFLTQREVGTRSLDATITHFQSSADATTLIQQQFSHWQTAPLFPDALPFLRFLADRQLPVCVLSNIDRVDIEAAVAHHGLHFDHLVTSDDVRSYKPRPEMFRHGLAMLGLAPHQVLHVGDSRSNDVAGAGAVGIPVAWVNRKSALVPSGHDADYVVNDLMGLVGIITERTS